MTKDKQLFLRVAYGRSYPTNEAMLKDWEDGKDFKIDRGPYCSIRDLEVLKQRYSSIVIFQNCSVFIELT